ncbi:hypothetical protein BKA83DRAFT_4126510 [Pisolithus microcarpus]|nr:hypothetical protein BKA83DRAFT_4126510 [Pisolithus microcarpus]
MKLRQQLVQPSRCHQSVEVKEYLPELHEQPSLRAVEPLESEHMEVLIGMVKELDEIEDVNRMAKLAREAAGHARGVDTSDKTVHEDLPIPQLDTTLSIKLKGE